MNPSPAYSYTSLDSFDSRTSPTTTTKELMEANYYNAGIAHGGEGMPGTSSDATQFSPIYTDSYTHTADSSSRGPGRSRRSPDNLLGLDAPVQPRHYQTPSVTSRKEVPSYFLKRRPQIQKSDDDEDDELTEELPSNATDQERIEFRRHRNTIAARRSRRRKVAYQQELEETVERLKIERQKWKTRAETLRQLIRGRGIPCPEWSE